jgi:hypothetical protein
MGVARIIPFGQRHSSHDYYYYYCVRKVFRNDQKPFIRSCFHVFLKVTRKPKTVYVRTAFLHILQTAIYFVFRVVFWHILPCKIIVDRRFWGASFLHHQGSSGMMEALRTSETSVDNHFTRQYIPEHNSEHHTRRRENLISHSYYVLKQH